MRVLTALLLSLVLAIASVSMAVARGQVPMGATIALCTATGTVSVTLDANGNPQPTGPHLCPDCLSATTAFALSAEIALPAPRITSRLLTACPSPRLPAGLTRVPGRARDPPALAV